MDTEQNDSICRNRLSAGPRRRSRTGGFTLAEIMVATVIFSIMSLALGASLIQNDKFTNALSYRTQALNISMGMVEQMRNIAYIDMLSYCNNVAGIGTGTQTTINVAVMDPWQANPDSTGFARANYQLIQLPINQLTMSITAADGTVSTPTFTNNNWLQTSIPMDTSKTAQQMPIRWWLAVTRNVQTSQYGATTATSACDAFEISLIYQWQIPGVKNPTWQSGVIRLAITNDAAS